MGLIARAIEAAGIPTLCLTSALSITQAVGPPRAAFLDYPLGHTAGPPHDPALQRAILLAALAGFETIEEPGGVLTLDRVWPGGDAWKDSVVPPRAPGGSEANGGASEDDRSPRRDTPQYQTEQDRALADAALARGGCRTCVFLE